MAGFENEKKALQDAMVAYKVPGILDAVEKARAAKMPANDIINAMGDGMTEVGVLFERGKLFLPHVLSAAAGMTKAMNISAEYSARFSARTSKRASFLHRKWNSSGRW